MFRNYIHDIKEYGAKVAWFNLRFSIARSILGKSITKMRVTTKK